MQSPGCSNGKLPICSEREPRGGRSLAVFLRLPEPANSYSRAVNGRGGPILVRCPGTTNRHRRGGPVDLSCFGRATVYVDKLLTELPTKIQTTAERGYLEEALICFRNKAF